MLTFIFSFRVQCDDFCLTFEPTVMCYVSVELRRNVTIVVKLYAVLFCKKCEDSFQGHGHM